MLESFGARLRQRREELGVALGTIADRTKIKRSLLDALERDDVSHWPSGIYRRAYIRAYAQAVGLDPDVIVREFLEVHPEPDEILAAEAIAAAAETARTNGGPPTRLRYLVGSAIGSLARLRRSPEVEHPGLAAATPVDLAVPAESDLLAAGHPSFDPARFEALNEAAVACTPESVPASFEPEPPAAAEPAPEPQPALTTNAGVAGRTTVNDPAPPDPDFAAVAHLCTELGRIDDTGEVQPLLEEAARILDARGLIVWIWDGSAEGLRPALVHGYSEKVLAHLPTVRPEEDNATAAAFRSAQVCALAGGDHASGALAVPLLTPDGCAGVFAIELRHGREPTTSLRAAATILGAQMAQLAGPSRTADVQPYAGMNFSAGGDLHDTDFSYQCAPLTKNTSDAARTRTHSAPQPF